MARREKLLEELTIKDDFMFGAVMRNPKQCKKLLECILKIKITKIEYPELQKSVDHTYDAKGIRLDVYVEDEEHTIYNIEIQTTDKKYLPKRMRYYQGMIDLNIISKGKDYKTLRRSYIIFICNYDEYGQGRHIYTFENRCIEDSSIAFGDDTVKIVLNTKGTMDDVDEELRDVLHYIGGEAPKGEFSEALDKAVNEIKNSEEWRREYMTLLMRDRENQQLGETRKVVLQVRKNISKMTPESMADIFDVDVQIVERIISLIKEHPDMDNEDIALELESL